MVKVKGQRSNGRWFESSLGQGKKSGLKIQEIGIGCGDLRRSRDREGI